MPEKITLFGQVLTDDQLIQIGVLILLMVLLSAGLIKLSKALRKRGQRFAGLMLFAGFLYIPLAGFYGFLTILDAHRTFVDADPQAGIKAHYETLVPAQVLLFLILVIGVYIVTSVLDAVLFSSEAEKKLGWRVPSIVRDSARWIVLILATLTIAAQVFDWELTNLTLFASAVTLGISFAVGPTLGALISGMALTSERPFDLGDWIDVGVDTGQRIQGRVDQITWRSTRIITRDNQSVILPNGRLAEQMIVNLSRPDPRLGVRVCVGVHYRTPPLKVRKALRKALKDVDRVLPFPEAAIRLLEYADSSMNWEIRFWTTDAQRMEDTKSEVMQRIWYQFDRSGIEIPFPIRNIVTRDENWEEGRRTDFERAEEKRQTMRLLARTPIFKDLPTESRAKLAAAVQREAFLDGETVTLQGDTGDRMFIIETGSARVSVDVEGPHDLEHLASGDFFGEIALLTGSPRAATVVAQGPLHLLSLRAADVRPLLEEDEHLAKALADFAAERKMDITAIEDQVREEKEKADHETTSGNLLHDIKRFFGLGASKQS
ncbi:MAG: cyclic nucleotide-binding domain-containing protein [Planctomycetota bacterium]